MNTLYCGQKGCSFEIEDDGDTPENCPVCGNPFFNHPEPEKLTAVETVDTDDTDDTDDTENADDPDAATKTVKKSKRKFQKKK